MDELKIKNQWRVLFPDETLDQDALQQANDFGFNAVIVKQNTACGQLLPILLMESKGVSPFELDLSPYEAWPKGIYWKSSLKIEPFKEELLKRAMLPLELYLEEITAIKRVYPKIPLFYEFSNESLSIERLLKETVPDVYFIFSHVKGQPKRLDLPAHPWFKIPHSRLIPLYDAEPLKNDGEGEWPYLFFSKETPSVFVKTAAWNNKPRLQDQLKLLCGRSVSDYEPFDPQLSLLQAIIDGEVQLKPDEMRLLSDLFLAKFRWELSRGNAGSLHESIKSLLIRAFQSLRQNVPPQLNLENF